MSKQDYTAMADKVLIGIDEWVVISPFVLRILRDMIADGIKQAVLDERKACIKLLKPFGGFTKREITRRIRERG